MKNGSKRIAVLIAVVIAVFSLCGFTAYELGLFDPWLQKPSAEPIETVLSAIEGQADKEYTLALRVENIKVDEDETAHVKTMYSDSELAEARGWTDEYLEEHFVVVWAKYYTEYDHTKTFLDDGYTEQYTDRESLPDYIRRYFDPGEWKESSGSKVLSFDEWQKKCGKALDKSGGSGIIEMTRRKNGAHRRANARSLQIIDKPTYNKLTSDFLKHDGIIVRGEEAARHLGDKHYAAYLPSFNTAFIRDDATVSEVLEEMYHAKQDRLHLFGDTLTTEVYLRREIDAQKYLLSLSERYKIPQEEIEVTKGNLEQYENELKKLLGGE